jgi:uncharacterized protein
MNLRAALFLLAFLILIPSTEPLSAQDCGPRPRLISVVGTSEINVAPDQVVLNLGVESRDRELAVAKSQTDSRIKKIFALAHEAGVDPKDVATSMVRMNANYSEEKIPRFLAYEVSQSTTITLKDISKYDSLISKLLKAGANRIDGVYFGVRETRKYRDEARSKAILAAKEKAAAMAAELGQTLGKPWEISEESGWNSYQYMANNVSRDKSVSAEDESTVAPGEITIRASVKVSFQLE